MLLLPSCLHHQKHSSLLCYSDCFYFVLFFFFYRTDKTCLPLCWKFATSSWCLCWGFWLPATTSFLQLSTRIGLPSLWVSEMLLLVITKWTFALKICFHCWKILLSCLFFVLVSTRTFTILLIFYSLSTHMSLLMTVEWRWSIMCTSLLGPLTNPLLIFSVAASMQ